MFMKKQSEKVHKEKVTIGEFFRVQWLVIKELYGKYKLETTGIIILAWITMCVNFIDLKFLEYTTNSVSEYVKSGNIHTFKALSIIIGLFLIVLFVMHVMQNINNKITKKYVSMISFEVEKKIINKLSTISYEFYEDNNFYYKINLATQASGQYSNAIFGVTQITRIILMLFVYGIMLSKISVLFVVIIFIAIIISIMASTKVKDKQLDYYRKHVSPESRRNNYFKSVFNNRINQQNIQTARSFSYFSDKYSYYNKLVRKNYLKLNMLSFTSELITSLLFILTFFVTVLFISKGVASGKYEIGYYSMVIALLGNLFSTIKQFSSFMMKNNWYVKVLDVYYEVMNLETELFISTNECDAAIEFKDLKYKYPQSEHYALNGINIKFNMGEKVAVVGHNGSGKTTLISVIMMLLKNYYGECNYNNIIQMAIMQEFGQYQMSIKENIEIGCSGKEISEEKIVEILKKVDLFDFISQMPNGIYTKLGQLEEGVELSKGQWQRLAIARLLAKEEANVWILDEPTAYLDPIAEIDMYNFIFRLAGERLVFFISHRLGFAKYADRIIVVNNGEIVEDGKHKTLIANSNGIYAQMFKTQKEWYS